MNKNLTAWEMDPEQLVGRFARLCADVGSANGVMDIMEGHNRGEACYFSGVIVARLLGKDKELPFRRDDRVVLKSQKADSSWHGVFRLRLQYEPEENKPSWMMYSPTIQIIPRDGLTVSRVHYRNGNFFLELLLPGEHSQVFLFPASEFLAAQENPVSVTK